MRPCNCIGKHNGGRFHDVTCAQANDLWDYWHSPEYLETLDKPKPEESMEEIPKLKPLKSRVRLPDPEVWDLHAGDARHDPRDGFYHDLHTAQTALRNACTVDMELLILPHDTHMILHLALTTLERVLGIKKPNHQNEPIKPF